MFSARNVVLPKGPNIEGHRFENVKSMVIFGANGSGKTMICGFLEVNAHYNDRAIYRIMAQRALSIPNEVQIINSEIPRRELLQRQASWSTKLEDDFGLILQYLLSESNEVSIKFRYTYQTTGEIDSTLSSIVDKIKTIWEKILPYITLKFQNNFLEAEISNSASQVNTFIASTLSDGEKQVLYLISKVLIAPEGAIVIIDEPEIHIHRALLPFLCTELENARPDCIFIYVTQDLDLVASKTEAIKVWMKGFELNNIWDWEDITGLEFLPEEVFFRVLGARRNVVFVEGLDGSIDSKIYRLLFPDYLVVPKGSYLKVLESAKIFKESSKFHRLNVKGLIDRDYHPEYLLDDLKRKGLCILKVAEIENLLLVEDVVNGVAISLSLDPESVFQNVKKYAFDLLKRNIAEQINRRVLREIQVYLGRFETKINAGSEIDDSVQDYIAKLDIAEIQERNERLYNNIVYNADYGLLLKYYKDKYLLNGVSACFGLGQNQFVKVAIDYLGNKASSELFEKLSSYLDCS